MSRVGASGLSVALGDRTVLEDIDLRVDAGEIVTLLGPSGSSKTTSLRALLGVLAHSTTLFASSTTAAAPRRALDCWADNLTTQASYRDPCRWTSSIHRQP